MTNNSHDKSFNEQCIDLMLHAEIHDDKELQEGLTWLGKEAIKDNVSIYDKINEVLTKHRERQKEIKKLTDKMDDVKRKQQKERNEN